MQGVRHGTVSVARTESHGKMDGNKFQTRGGLEAALERCARFGVRPGLDAIRAACSAMGNPQNAMRIVHVAGTNGKGATCALIDSALRAAGYRTGRYTSPHLTALNERFFLDGKPTDPAKLDAAYARTPGEEGLTYFELLTATAFELYGSEKVDWLVLETGLGGRFDATNVVEKPAITAITRIGLDHCDWLGGTVEAIAHEKGGIIKTGVPCVLGAMPFEARSVLEAIASENGSKCIVAPEGGDASGGLSEALGHLALAGDFNRENACTAYAVLKELGIQDEHIVCGYSNVDWPGRYQIVEREEKRVLVDGAHNPPAMKALCASLSKEREREGGFPFSGRVVCGFCGDKDVAESLRILRGVADEGFAVAIRNPRTLPSCRTAELMREAGFGRVHAAETLREALDAAGDGALVCGSLFLAGEALEELGARPAGGFVPNESFVRREEK